MGRWAKIDKSEYKVTKDIKICEKKSKSKMKLLCFKAIEFQNGVARAIVD
ncbi:MAG: hypothetical protein LBL77_02275 [Endomicrobium sp.]|jgi:hypothetical protein|nr:hypothetical protein [Endomicrobium sp.]